jgi:WD40 repeat protein
MSGDTPKRYWQAETEQSVNVIVFSPSGTQLAAGQGSGSLLDAGFISVWNMSTGEPIKSFLTNTFAVEVLAFSPDERILASGGGYSPTRMGGDYDVRLWNTTTWGEARESPGRGVGMVTSIAFSNDGQYFFFGSRDGPIHIIDTQDWEPVTSIHETGVSWINYLPENQQLVLGYRLRIETWTLHHEPEIHLTRTIIWDDANGENIEEFLNGEFVIDCEADLFVTATVNGTLAIRNTTTGDVLHIYQEASEARRFLTAAINPDRSQVAFVSDTSIISFDYVPDQVLHVWDFGENTEPMQIPLD